MPKISELAQQIKELTEQLVNKLSKDVQTNDNTGINKETGK